jgi:hypothetical protein
MVDDPRLQTKIGEHNEDGGMGMVYYERSVFPLRNELDNAEMHS